MSAYEPPTATYPTFDSLVFQTPNSASLTLAEGDLRYLARNNIATSNASLTSFAGGITIPRINTTATSVAFGNGAGTTNQGGSSVAIGPNAGNNTQQTNAVAIGVSAGATTQRNNTVAIGTNAGQTNQQLDAIAIGDGAGTTTQASAAVAIGFLAGNATQSANSVSIGTAAGQTTQGSAAVAIGLNAGNSNQGNNAIAIGNGAGQNNQTAGSIAINASGVALNTSVAGCHIDPIRRDIAPTVANSPQYVMYNSSKELTAYPFANYLGAGIVATVTLALPLAPIYIITSNAIMTVTLPNNAAAYRGARLTFRRSGVSVGAVTFQQANVGSVFQAYNAAVLTTSVSLTGSQFFTEIISDGSYWLQMATA